MDILSTNVDALTLVSARVSPATTSSEAPATTPVSSDAQLSPTTIIIAVSVVVVVTVAMVLVAVIIIVALRNRRSSSLDITKESAFTR